MGGHGVPEEKIKSGYYNALDLIPDLVEICDIVHIYDNTNVPFRIFKKRKDIYFHWENKYWSYSGIKNSLELVNIVIKSSKYFCIVYRTTAFM